jgi:RNA-dependent RNA polymerase
MRLRGFPAFSASATANLIQPTYWNTYRWTFIFTSVQLDKFMLCMQNLRLLAEGDPDMDLVARGTPQWNTVQMGPTENKRWYIPPDISNVDFSARVLIEGLIGHGIIKPGDINPLLASLATHAIVPAFRDRILESMYNEDRIRNIPNLVRSEFIRKSAQG